MADETPDLLEPKIVSAAERRRLQQWYDQACKLMAKEGYDYDYANKALVQCVIGDPGNLVYVEPFLNNLQQKYDNNKSGARFQGFGGKGAFKKALNAKDWHKVLAEGPPLLEKNPWDVYVLRGLAQACEEFFYNEVELRYLKNALDAKPKDVDVNRHCGESLARMGQFDQAIACFQRIEDVRRNDKYALEMISTLTVEKTRVKSGITIDNPRLTPEQRERLKRFNKIKEAREQEAAKAEEEKKPESTAPRTIELTPRQKLERAIQDFPGEIDNYFELAELLIGEARFNDAQRVLTKAQSVAGNDLNLSEKIEDVQLLKIKEQLKIAKQQAVQSKSDAAKELVEQFKGELLRQELEVFNRRAEQYPENADLKLHLGVALKQAGNFAEALKRLDEARQQEESLADRCYLEMGECFHNLKSYAKALKCYLRSAEASAESPDYQKWPLYRAGVLALGLKELDKAEQWLAAAHEIDPDFKDVASRLDKLRKDRDNS